MKIESLYKKAIRDRAREIFKQTGQLPGNNKHGSHQAYVFYGCRCELCTSHHNQYQLDLAKRSPTRHGIYGYKTQGCRCNICKASVKKYFQVYRSKSPIAA